MQQTISAPAPAAAPAIDSRARRQVAAWLLLCCALVFAMVVVGGVTRLTRSGLSIVEWQPLMGAIPPLSESHWQELFAKYQRTPEYLQVNQGMPLDEFKRIFWWEYMHRLLGRVIGLAFFVPLVWFLVKGRIARALAPRLVVIFLLGGLQGAVGWWMVKSGLIDDPRVSHVRLSIHLGIAFIIFAAMFWTALGLLSGEVARDPLRRRLAGYGAGLSALIFVMVLSGGLVAGTRAGYAYNTFPLMNGHVLPPEYFMLEPWWENLLHNMATVQFNHRLIAWLLFFSIPAFWWALRRFRFALPSRARVASSLLLAMLGLQLALGIGTLLLRVPVTLGAAHQAGAMLLFALALWTTHTLYREPLRTGQT